MRNQRCHEVQFEDGSVCSSIPESDMVKGSLLPAVGELCVFTNTVFFMLYRS